MGETHDDSLAPLFQAHLDPLSERLALESIRHNLFGRASSPVRIGRYIIGERIGEGGGGRVYKGFDPELERPVAIKLLRSTTSKASLGLLREAQAVARLAHPNVVAVYDVGTVDAGEGLPSHQGSVYVVMELVEGESLAEWARRSRPRWTTLVQMFEAAARGVAAAHARGIVHRDLKPSNILIGADGRVRVLDFGLARLQRDGATPEHPPAHSGAMGSAVRVKTQQTTDGAVLGTPNFMAPEQHRGAAVDHRADQFSLCASFWAVLFECKPFEGETMRMLELSKRNGPPAPPPGSRRAPGWLVRILQRGMHPDPDRRFASLERLMGELGRQRRRRRRGFVALSALALCGGLLALAHHEGNRRVVVRRRRRASTRSGPLPCEDDSRPRSNPPALLTTSCSERRRCSTATPSSGANGSVTSSWARRWGAVLATMVRRRSPSQMSWLCKHHERRCRSSFAVGRPEQGWRWVDRAREAGLEGLGEQHEQVLYADFLRSKYEVEFGHLDRAIERLEGALEHSLATSEQGPPFGIALTCLQARAELLRGNVQRAERIAGAGLEQARHRPERNAMELFRCVATRVAALRLRGELAAAEQVLNLHDGSAELERGRLRLAVGDRSGARKAFEAAAGQLKEYYGANWYPTVEPLFELARLASSRDRPTPEAHLTEALRLCDIPHGDGRLCGWIYALAARDALRSGNRDAAKQWRVRAQDELRRTAGPIPHRRSLETLLQRLP